MMQDKNPWLSIWISPRETIARIGAENPNRSVWLLSSIYGFSSLMNLFQSLVLGSAMSPLAIVVAVIVLSPLYGYLSFSVWSWFVLGIGKLFKGQGTFKTVRAAYAWSSVPIALNIPLWLLMVFLFGHQLFLNFPDAHLLTQSQVLILFLILIAKVILSIWSLVIYLNALAEVQKYSIFRAIFNVLAAGFVLALIFFLFWNLLVLWKPF